MTNDELKLGDHVRVTFTEASEFFEAGTEAPMMVMQLDPLRVGTYTHGGVEYVFGPASYQSVEKME